MVHGDPLGNSGANNGAYSDKLMTLYGNRNNRMAQHSLSQIVHKAYVGLTLRCPNCEQGQMFDGLLHMRKECPVCNVRFERQSGESVGGMYFNLGIAELITIPGFLLIDTLFHPPFVPHALFWLVFTILFCLFFYRHARGMWV